MGKVVNKITFIMTWPRDLLKSQAKVVVHIDKIVKFLVRQAVANLCSKANVLQLRSHPLDDTHCETSRTASFCSAGVLEPNIIHQDAAGASAIELVTNIFEICNRETTVVYGVTLTWACLWVNRRPPCHFSAKLTMLLAKHLSLLQCLHGGLDIRHALKCIL
jgi:hypothetical protein